MLALLVAALLHAPTDVRVLSVPVVEAAALPDLHTFASTTAQQYGLDPLLFSKVITCESQWRPEATSSTADFGIVQIHLASHSDVSLEQANNPYWAITWMAQQWVAKHQTWWTCYKNESRSSRN